MGVNTTLDITKEDAIGVIISHLYTASDQELS